TACVWGESFRPSLHDYAYPVGKAALIARQPSNAFGNHDVGREPVVTPAEQPLGGLVALSVVVAVQFAEQAIGATTRLVAEQVGELVDLIGMVGLHAYARVRVGTRSRNREQLGADVDDPPQKLALVLESPLVDAHQREDLARELARVTLGP